LSWRHPTRQFSQDTGEWLENEILIPDWTYFHCPDATLHSNNQFTFIGLCGRGEFVLGLLPNQSLVVWGDDSQGEQNVPFNGPQLVTNMPAAWESVRRVQSLCTIARRLLCTTFQFHQSCHELQLQYQALN